MEVMVEFIICSNNNFPVEKMINDIGIEEYELQKKGDVVLVGEHKNISRIETHTSIMYTTGYIKTIDVEIPLKKMQDMLINHKNKINDYITKYKLSAKFCVVINLTDFPSIIISKEFINLASQFNAEIEFDSYVDLPYEIIIKEE